MYFYADKNRFEKRILISSHSLRKTKSDVISIYVIFASNEDKIYTVIFNSKVVRRSQVLKIVDIFKMLIRVL